MLHVEGMRGLGDNIYQRSFIKAAPGRVWLDTPWPELYADLPGVQFVKGSTPLRTQAKNIARQDGRRWSARPREARTVRISYGHAALAVGTIRQAMERCFGWAPAEMDLPDFGSSPLSRKRRPIALVRPVTERREWLNVARNPRPEYVAEIAADLMRTHHVVSVADLAPGEEWALDPLPPAHTMFHRGELPVDQLLALVRHADVAVGGVGWLVPAVIASGTRAFIVQGGQLVHNGPDKVETRPWMGWGRPANPCRCADMRHACDKTIPDLMDQWGAWRDAAGV